MWPFAIAHVLAGVLCWFALGVYRVGHLWTVPCFTPRNTLLITGSLNFYTFKAIVFDMRAFAPHPSNSVKYRKKSWLTFPLDWQLLLVTWCRKVLLYPWFVLKISSQNGPVGSPVTWTSSGGWSRGWPFLAKWSIVTQYWKQSFLGFTFFSEGQLWECFQCSVRLRRWTRLLKQAFCIIV